MRSPRPLLAGLVGVLALSGCGAAAEAAPIPAPTTSVRNVQFSATFSTSGGAAVTYDTKLVPAGSRGAVSSTSADGNTTVRLALRGLKPNRRYSAHAHTEPCGDTGDAAGPHFQNVVDPVQPSVDPQYANPKNEIWLAVKTDAAGAATATTIVPWEFPTDRRARSVVVHALPTATAAGKAGMAGDRVACISVPF